MYAIVDIAGQQFKVEKDQKIFVHRLDGETGSKVTFDKVLLIDNDSNVTLGDPVIKGAAVSAEIIEHLKGDKVLVFKKKRRKGYQKLNGHRQFLTRIQIADIIEKGAKAAEEKKAAPAPKAKAEVKEEVKTEVKAEVKAVAPKKAAAEKKPAAAKTTAAKKPAAAKASTKEGEAPAKKAAPKKAAPKKSDDKAAE